MSEENTTEKTILENFYSEREPDEKAATMSDLLPVTPKTGAPEGAAYFMEFADVTVKLSEKHPDWPYVNARLKVVEPDDYENQGFYTFFWLPPVYNDMDEKELKKVGRQTDGLYYNIDTICGEGVANSLFEGVNDQDTAVEAMEKLADLLDEERAVVTVRIQTPNKARQAQGYTDKFNSVKGYANAATWEGEDI